MGTAFFRTLGLSALAAPVLIVASDLPFIGSLINFPGLNWVIWIGLWALLADRFVKEARPALALSENPSIPAMGAGALLGVASGLVGQLIQLVIQGVIMTAAANRVAQAGSVAASTLVAATAFSAFGSLVDRLPRLWRVLGRPVRPDLGNARAPNASAGLGSASADQHPVRKVSAANA